jgi:hypothetical protein
MVSTSTLLRLSRNPHYKMSQRELEELSRFQNQEFEKQRNVKHNYKFRVHDPSLPEEKGSNGQERKTTTRG